MELGKHILIQAKSICIVSEKRKDIVREREKNIVFFESLLGI